MYTTLGKLAYPRDKIQPSYYILIAVTQNIDATLFAAC